LTEEEFRGRPIEKKDTNPKDAVGIRKAPMSCVPANIMMKLGLAMMEGARKYGRHNYRAVGVRGSVYYDAALRHLMRWWEGRDIDPDSGLPELVKAMACLCVIQDSIDRGNWVDDRPPATEGDWLEQLNKKAGDLIDRLPIAKEPYTNLTVAPLEQPCSSTACPTQNPAPQWELPLEYRNWIAQVTATAEERAS
jgi:hypothetical protein